MSPYTKTVATHARMDGDWVVVTGDGCAGYGATISEARTAFLARWMKVWSFDPVVDGHVQLSTHIKDVPPHLVEFYIRHGSI